MFIFLGFFFQWFSVRKNHQKPKELQYIFTKWSYFPVLAMICCMFPGPDASQILSQAPLQKRNDFFDKVITNPSLFAQIQLGSILTHSQVDFQEHSKVPECELLVGFSAGIIWLLANDVLLGFRSGLGSTTAIEPPTHIPRATSTTDTT